MSKVLVNESTLSSIAGAVRDKTGTTNTYKPAEMAGAIQGITTGGGLLESGFGERFVSSSMSANDVNNILIDAVENGVTTIPNYRFSDYDNNSIDGGGTLYIPQGITTIGEYAFSNCEIEIIELPAGLITIGADAFDNCSCLSAVKNELVIPSSVETIGKNAFGNIYNLSAVYFKGTPTSIGVNCFDRYCHCLTDIYVPWSEDSALNDVAWNSSSATVHYNYAG